MIRRKNRVQKNRVAMILRKKDGQIFGFRNISVVCKKKIFSISNPVYFFLDVYDFSMAIRHQWNGIFGSGFQIQTFLLD